MPAWRSIWPIASRVRTRVGQVTSIRTLERQIRRLKASAYAEVREIGEEIAAACSCPPECVWSNDMGSEPLAPTLARHVDPDQHLAQSHRDLEQWARENLPAPAALPVEPVHVVRPIDTHADIVTTLLYPVSDRPYYELHEIVSNWSSARRNEVIHVALRSRTKRDELLRGFRGGLYAFDITRDIGAYRDMHRHRRGHQYRQTYSGGLGYD